MKHNELLAELGAYMGLANVALDANGACRLIFDDTVNVDLVRHSEEAHLLIIHVIVAPTPHEGRLEFYQQLLAGHYLGAETNGATFALDEQTGDVLLWTSFNVDQGSVESLANKLTQLVRSARAWQEKLTIEVQEVGSLNPLDVFLTGMIRV